MSDADDIQRFYQAGLEAGRLLEGSGVIELARTQDILERYLPPPPARVLDVGGGTGVYARWLAGRGYEVHLLDHSPRHIEEARAHPGPPLARAEVGDARRLDDAEASADVVLLLGPLYHLVERDDRVKPAPAADGSPPVRRSRPRGPGHERASSPRRAQRLTAPDYSISSVLMSPMMARGWRNVDV